MKTLQETVTGTYFETSLHYSVVPVGYGNWNIVCEAEFNRHKKQFKCHTTNSEMIDTITEMKAEGASYEELQVYMHSQVFEEIRYEVEEWLYINFE